MKLEHCLLFNITKSAKFITRYFNNTYLSKCGVSFQQFIVLYVIHHYYLPNLTHTALILGLDRTTLSRSCKLLVKNNLIKIKDTTDKREISYELTDFGLNILERANKGWDKFKYDVPELIGKIKMDEIINDMQFIFEEYYKKFNSNKGVK